MACTNDYLLQRSQEHNAMVASRNHKAARFSAFLLAASLSAGLQAQLTELHHFRAPQPLDRAAEKAVWSVLVPLDEHALMNVHGDLVKARVREGLGSEVLLNALNSTGLGPFQLVRPDVPTAGKDRFDDFPQLIDTGDPEQDEAELGRAKEAWFAANPGALELYRARLLGTAPCTKAQPVPND
jgi:hypothetical protein